MKHRAVRERVDRFVERLARKGVFPYGMMLSQDGDVLAEGYSEPFRPGETHRVYSVSKTFTGIAVGMLINEGRLGLDDRIASFFEDWLPELPSEYMLRLTLRDMLRMATCYGKTAYKEGVDTNWARSFFTGTPDHEPGTVFSYDTGCSQVLAALVRRVSGQEVIDFLEERLLRPLGCRDPRRWLRDPSGCCQGGTGLCMSLRDMHRVAVCLMNGGEGIVPAWYVREMTRKQIDTSLQGPEEERYGYGWQCWRTRSGWAMYGMGGQLAVICPDKRLILATVADTRLDPAGVQKIYDAFYEEIEPYAAAEIGPGARVGKEADGENGTGKPLRIQLPMFTFPDCGCLVLEAMGDYVFEGGNPLGIQGLTLRETELEIRRKDGPARIAFRRGETIPGAYPGNLEVPAMIAAGWTEPGLLRIRCHAVGDAPCGFDMAVCLRGDRITVKSRCSTDPLTKGYEGIGTGRRTGGGVR